jgi:hypothetical protein
MELKEYSKQVNNQVRKYFDENDIPICFSINDDAMEESYRNNVSVDDFAKDMIEELKD